MGHTVKHENDSLCPAADYSIDKIREFQKVTNDPFYSWKINREFCLLGNIKFVTATFSISISWWWWWCGKRGQRKCKFENTKKKKKIS